MGQSGGRQERDKFSTKITPPKSEGGRRAKRREVKEGGRIREREGKRSETAALVTTAASLLLVCHRTNKEKKKITHRDEHANKYNRDATNSSFFTQFSQ